MRPDRTSGASKTTSKPKLLQKDDTPTDSPSPQQNAAQKKLADALKNTANSVAPAVEFRKIFQEVLEEVLYFQKAEWEATSSMERNLRLANPVEDSNSLIPFDADSFTQLVGRLAWLRAIKQLCMALSLGEFVDEIVAAEMDRVYRKDKPSKETK